MIYKLTPEDTETARRMVEELRRHAAMYITQLQAIADRFKGKPLFEKVVSELQPFLDDSKYVLEKPAPDFDPVELLQKINDTTDKARAMGDRFQLMSKGKLVLN
jgi:hypothetical protein